MKEPTWRKFWLSVRGKTHYHADGRVTPTVAGSFLFMGELAPNYLPLTVGSTLSSSVDLGSDMFFIGSWSFKSSIEVLQIKEEILGDIGSKFNNCKRIHINWYQSLIMSIDGHMPTQSHQEGPSDPSRMNLNGTLRSMQQSIKGLERQFQNIARDVEELKKSKSSATMKQRVGDNLSGSNSPHHKRPYDNVSTYGYHDMLVQHAHSIHEFGYQGRPQRRGGKKGGLGGRGYHRPQEEYPTQED
ncbi:hypothetical protein M9H77_26889 [Catharanthus roseus]|uniref:Uncharacterized protein n=1 Tax=Catharanthus roseus TaxID=4058 RepID=A0ACC0AF08_CATRO|nr:hypothetical protein M9H77_26889 [Catharanthus roseus]